VPPPPCPPSVRHAAPRPWRGRPSGALAGGGASRPRPHRPLSCPPPCGGRGTKGGEDGRRNPPVAPSGMPAKRAPTGGQAGATSPRRTLECARHAPARPPLPLLLASVRAGRGGRGRGAHGACCPTSRAASPRMPHVGARFAGIPEGEIVGHIERNAITLNFSTNRIENITNYYTIINCSCLFYSF
jgi:hypothetical protein